MKALFIGGSGVISAHATRHAVESGIETYVLNRGATAKRALPEGVTKLRADVRDPASLREAIGTHEFDVVVDWIAFKPEHVQQDVQMFQGRVAHYVFLSSASAYRATARPITESTPLFNPYMEYSRGKMACEDVLIRAYRDAGFPATIVRPSHTYDETRLPFWGGWTILGRMIEGREIVIHGDGSALWTLTHSSDFAQGLIPLLGNPRAIGDAFHITSDFVLTWNEIAETLAAAAGVRARIVHVATDAINAEDEVWGGKLLGDKVYSKVFDTSKLRGLVPNFAPQVTYEQGARAIVQWYRADPRRQVVDTRFDAVLDRLVNAHRVPANRRSFSSA